MLDRDFDLEEETGLCSYCGKSLLPIAGAPNEDLIFLSCPACDAYDEYEHFEYDDDFWDDDLFIKIQMPDDN